MSKVPLDSELRRVPAESENDLKIVQAGHQYHQPDALQNDALESYFSKRQDHDSSKTFHTTNPEVEIYHSLMDSQDMRVLELCAGDFDDDIYCRLHICSVDFEYPTSKGSNQSYETVHAISRSTKQPIWYTALSYTWGDGIFSKIIICDSKIFKTTKNVDCALRHLRQTNKAVMLWIDQICINQADPREKTQQVLLMDKIYRRAWSTLVWLGEEADNSDDAIEYIKKINNLFQLNITDEAPDVDSFAGLSLAAPGSQSWLALDKFLSRPWFQRAWVIQEVVLSRNVQALCGRKCVSWDEIGNFGNTMIANDMTQYLESYSAATGHISESGCDRIHMINGLKVTTSRMNQKLSLLPLLVQARGAQATNLRDKVFAVMAMASTIVHPDYSRSVSEVYSEAGRILINVDMGGSLCCVDHAQPPADLPSWAPDWSVPRRTVSLGFRGASAGIYQAAKGSKIRLRFLEDKNSLMIQGLIFDTISLICVSPGYQLKDLPDQNSPSSLFARESLRIAIENCQPYPSDTGLFDAFWRTLVTGKDASGLTKAPPDFAEVFAFLIDCATGCSPSLPDQPHAKRKLSLERLKIRRPGHIYRQMQKAFEAAVHERRFGTTSKRYMGLFPRGSRPGDEVCIFFGACVPFVIRRCETRDTFQLLGECYVHGIMDGEAMQMTELIKQDITLI